MASYNNTINNSSGQLIIQSYVIILLLLFMFFMISAMGLVLVYNKIQNKNQNKKNATNMVSTSNMYNVENKFIPI